MTEKQTKDPFDFEKEFADFEQRIMDITPNNVTEQRIQEEQEQRKWDKFARRPLSASERIQREGRNRRHHKVGGSALRIEVDGKPSREQHIPIMHIPTPGTDPGVQGAEIAWLHSQHNKNEAHS